MTSKGAVKAVTGAVNDIKDNGRIEQEKNSLVEGPSPSLPVKSKHISFTSINLTSTMF